MVILFVFYLFFGPLIFSRLHYTLYCFFSFLPPNVFYDHSIIFSLYLLVYFRLPILPLLLRRGSPLVFCTGFLSHPFDLILCLKDIFVPTVKWFDVQYHHHHTNIISFIFSKIIYYVTIYLIHLSILQ